MKIDQIAADIATEQERGVFAQPSEPPPSNPRFDPVAAEIASEQVHEDETAANLVRWRAVNDATDPGRRADVLRYSAASGFAPDFVDKNLDQVKRRVDAEKVDWSEVAYRQPALLEHMLQRPESQPLVKDDVASLRGVEWGMKAPLHALWDHINLQRAIARQGAEAFGAGGEENRQKIQELEAQYGNRDYGAETVFQKGLIGLAKNAPMLAGDLGARLLGGWAGSAVGAAVGGTGGAAAGGVGAAPGAAGGAMTAGVLGQFVGSGLFNYFETLGPLYWQLSNLKDADHQPLDPAVARSFAQGGAVINGALGAVMWGKLGSKIPGVQSLLSKVGANAVEKAIVQRTATEAMKRFVLNYGEHLATGATMMAAQSAVTSAAEESAKAVSSNFDANWSNVANAAAEGFKSGLLDMSLVAAIGPGAAFLKDVGRARKSAESAARLEALTESAAASKLLERSPEEFQRAAARMKEEKGAVKDVLVPSDRWVAYWQAKKLDPAEMAAAVMGDDGKAYADALATGGDLAIPVEKYLSKLARTEHAAGLAQDSRLYPDAMTPREHADEEKRLQERLKEQAKVRGKELERGKQVVFDVIRQQAEEAGIPRVDAEANAKLVSEFSGTMALRMGIDVREAAAIAGLGRLRILGPRGEAAALNAREQLRRFLEPEASTTLAERLKTMSPETRAREVFIDSNTGLLNEKAFNELPSDKPLTGHISVEGIKYLNDTVSHDHADKLYRAVAKALHEVDPTAAKVGGDFAVRVGSEEELQALVKRVNEALPVKGFEVTGAIGNDLKAAGDAHTELKKAAEAAGTRALSRREVSPGKFAAEKPLGLQGEAKDLVFPEERAAAQVPEELQRRIGGLSDKQFFHEAYVEKHTGLLTSEGWNAIPRKAAVAALDLRGLKKVNELFGAAKGDEVLRLFGDTAGHFGGSSFDFAHLHGDEYAAQHSDPAVLEGFVAKLREKLQDVGAPAEIKGEPVVLGVDFRHGIGEWTYESADRDLNARKQRETAAQDLPSRAGGDEPQARGPEGGQRDHLQGQDNLAGRRPEGVGLAADEGGAGQGRGGLDAPDGVGFSALDASRPGLDLPDVASEHLDVPPRDAGRLEPAPRRQGATPQRYPTAHVIAHVEGQPVTFQQAAFHGSPHRFEKFSLHAMGTGEGNQAFGWGLYFAGDKALAEHYRKTLSGDAPLIDGKPADRRDPRHLAALALNELGGRREAIAELEADKQPDGSEMERLRQETLAILRSDSELPNVERHQGQLYKVDVPENEELLDYDKPISEQPSAVREKLSGALSQAEEIARGKGMSERDIEYLRGFFKTTVKGESLYDGLGDLLSGKLGGDNNGPQLASEFLRDHGIPGLRYLDGNSRGKGEGSHNYVIWDDGRVATKETFYQDPARSLDDGPSGGPRGMISMKLDPGGRPVAFDISILKGDRSTFAHETAHFLSWGLHELAQSDLATPGVRADYDNLLKWAGYRSSEERLAANEERSGLERKTTRTPDEEARLKHLTAKEERISHGWEQFLAEGVAPSEKLAGVFNRFKKWMQRIYKGVVGIQSQFRGTYGEELNLSDDVRAIFGRMLAVNDSVQAALTELGHDLPTDDLAAAMTPTEREEYRKALAASMEKADHDVTRRAIELEQEREKLTEERDRVTQDVANELDAQPVYRAMRYLQNGELADGQGNVVKGKEIPSLFLDEYGQPKKLSRKAFVEKYGPDAARRMPRGVFDSTKKGGASVEELSTLLGFESPDAFVGAMQKTESRDAVLSRQVQERMDATYGPALKAIQEAAMDAVHNDDSARATLLELRAMAKDVDPSIARRVQSIKLAVVKETAERMVGETKVGDLDPTRYARAERSSALRAAELRGAKRTESAIDHQETRLLNQNLYMAARDALAEVEGARSKLESTSENTRANLGKADPSYRDVHDAILQAVGLMDGKPGADAVGLDQMLKVMEGDAQDVAFDVSLVRRLLSAPTSWDELRVNQAREVADAITNIRHAARQRLELDLAGKKQTKDAWFTDLDAHVARRPELPSEPYTKNEAALTLAQKIRRKGRDADGMLDDVAETFAHMLDVGDREGPVSRLLIDERLACREKANELAKTVLEPLQEKFENIPEDIRKRMDDRVDVGELLQVPENSGPRLDPIFTRSDLWSLFLNWGSESNRQRIRDGNGWSDDSVNQALSLLTKPEAEFLQGIFDVSEKLYPELAKAHERRTGLKLGKVDSAEIVINGEKYSGGYHPLRYDSRFAKQGEMQEGDLVKTLFQPNYVRPTTPASHRKGRVERVNAPVDLSWGVVPAHFAQVVHDIAFGDWVRQAGSIVMDPRFKGVSERYLGRERSKQFVPWLRDVANAKADSASAVSSGIMREMGSFARARLTASVMAWNIRNVLQGMADPWLSPLEGVSNRHVTAAYLKMMNPAAWNEHPELALSKELAYREERYADNLRSSLGDAGRAKGRGVSEAITHTGLKLYEIVDGFSTRVVFKAAFDQAIAEGRTDKEAASFADDVIRKRFAAHDIAEKAQILRSKNGLAGLLVFYSYSSRNYNSLRRAWDDRFVAMNAKDATTKSKVEATAELAAKMMTFGLVSAAGAYLAGRGPRKDEDKAGWLARRMVLEPLNTVPFVGPIIESAIDKTIAGGGGRKFSARSAPELAFAEDVVNTLGDLAAKAHKGDSSAGERALLAAQALTFMLGGPTAQVGRSAKYIEKVRSGDARPRGPGDVAAGLIYGPDPGANPFTNIQDLAK